MRNEIEIDVKSWTHTESNHVSEDGTHIDLWPSKADFEDDGFEGALTAATVDKWGRVNFKHRPDVVNSDKNEFVLAEIQKVKAGLYPPSSDFISKALDRGDHMYWDIDYGKPGNERFASVQIFVGRNHASFVHAAIEARDILFNFIMDIPQPEGLVNIGKFRLYRD